MRFAMIALTGFVLINAGCNKGPKLPSPVPVTGKIMLKGKPVEAVTVAFSAMSGGLPGDLRHVKANTDAQGEYSMPKVYPAEYLVQVFKIDASTPTDPAQEVADPFANSPYAAYGPDSPLRAVVTKEATRFDFDLDPTKKK